MKYSDVQSMSRQELAEKKRTLLVALGKLEFERTLKTLKKGSELGKVRRDIARIQTALNSGNIQ